MAQCELTGGTPINLVIADDHPLFRQAVRQALASSCEDCHIDEANDFDHLDELLQADSDRDLVLLDLYMPGVHGLSALLYLNKAWPDLPVVMISANEDPAIMQRAVAYGASGYIPKSASLQTIVEALSSVLAGDIWLPEPARRRHAGGVEAHESELAALLQQLTPQQLRVLNLMSRGLANKNIADRLDLAEATVKVHITAIMRKLGVTNRTQAVLIANRLNVEQQQVMDY